MYAVGRGMNTKVKLEPFCTVIKSFEEVGRAIAYMHKHHANAVCAGDQYDSRGCA